MRHGTRKNHPFGWFLRGGEGGIRTLARFYPPTGLAIPPLQPLGYLSVFALPTEGRPRNQSVRTLPMFLGLFKPYEILCVERDLGAVSPIRGHFVLVYLS